LTLSIRFVVLIAILASVFSAVHYYFWVRLVRDTRLSGRARTLATASVVGLASLVAGVAIARLTVPLLSRWLALPAFIWLGAMSILLVILLALDVLRLLAALGLRLVRPLPPIDESRRTFTARILAGTALASAGGLAAAAVRATEKELAIQRIEVTLDRLPSALDGIRIVQLCDLHVGRFLGRTFVERVVHIANGLRPDIIAIVGDLVDGTIERLRPAVAPLADLRARYGTYFVTGNHEYYSRSGAVAWMDEIDGMGIRVLRNEHVCIGDGDAQLDIAGTHDHDADLFPDDGPSEDLPLALRGRDPSRAVVLLAHQPRTIHEAALLGVDLQLSGHTHGGQIWPWGQVIRLQQPFVRGLHRVGNTQIYVSCGTGFLGPPMRLGAPAEITEVILRSKPRAG
jgi:uncharacterized protein